MALAFHLPEFDEEQSIRLTKMIMRLFEHWQLTYEQQAILLGLSTNTRSSINRYKKGTSHIRLNQDTYDRITFFLSIHKSLRALFPMNLDLAYKWIKEPNLHFDHKAPIQIIAEEGFLGLVKVHDYLENVKA